MVLSEARVFKILRPHRLHRCPASVGPILRNQVSECQKAWGLLLDSLRELRALLIAAVLLQYNEEGAKKEENDQQPP